MHGRLLAVPEQQRQPAATFDQPALDRPARHPELPCDLVDREVGQVVQDEHLAVLARQLGEGLDQRPVLRFEGLDGRGRAEPRQQGGLPPDPPQPLLASRIATSRTQASGCSYRWIRSQRSAALTIASCTASSAAARSPVSG